jgi:hypothetical protein
MTTMTAVKETELQPKYDPIEGYRQMGELFIRHRTKQILWTATCQQWFDKTQEAGSIMTQERLIEYFQWFAQTRMDFQPDIKTKSSGFNLYRIKRVELWRKAENKTDIDQAMNLDLASVICASGFLSMETLDGRVRIRKIETLHSILTGRLDPSVVSDKGEGPGYLVPEISIFLNTLAFQLGEDLRDLNTLKIFASHFWEDLDLQPTGRLFRLIEGTLTAPVRADDFAALVRSIALFTKGSVKFSAEALGNFIAKRDTGQLYQSAGLDKL